MTIIKYGEYTYIEKLIEKALTQSDKEQVVLIEKLEAMLDREVSVLNPTKTAKDRVSFHNKLELSTLGGYEVWQTYTDWVAEESNLANYIHEYVVEKDTPEPLVCISLAKINTIIKNANTSTDSCRPIITNKEILSYYLMTCSRWEDYIDDYNRAYQRELSVVCNPLYSSAKDSLRLFLEFYENGGYRTFNGVDERKIFNVSFRCAYFKYEDLFSRFLSWDKLSGTLIELREDTSFDVPEFDRNGYSSGLSSRMSDSGLFDTAEHLTLNGHRFKPFMLAYLRRGNVGATNWDKPDDIVIIIKRMLFIIEYIGLMYDHINTTALTDSRDIVNNMIKIEAHLLNDYFNYGFSLNQPHKKYQPTRYEFWWDTLNVENTDPQLVVIHLPISPVVGRGEDLVLQTKNGRSYVIEKCGPGGYYIRMAPSEVASWKPTYVTLNIKR